MEGGRGGAGGRGGEGTNHCSSLGVVALEVVQMEAIVRDWILYYLHMFPLSRSTRLRVLEELPT